MQQKFLKLNHNFQGFILFVIFAFATYVLYKFSFLGGMLIYSLFVYMMKISDMSKGIPLPAAIFKGILYVSMFMVFHMMFSPEVNEYSKDYNEYAEIFKHTIYFFTIIILLTFIIIMKLEWAPKFLIGEDPEEKLNMAHAKIKRILEDNREELEKIELYTIDNLGRKYQALGMVESTETSKEDAKLALQLQAFRLEADAIVKMTLSTTSTTEGDMHADTILTPGGGGSIRSSVLYHYEGTAVKYLDI